MNSRQVPLYLAAIVVGVAGGWLFPSASPALAYSINPVLAALLYVTFLQVPFAQMGRGLKDIRFLAAVFALNFGVVPLVVFGLTRFIADDQAILVGVLLVLLAPCVDYVIVFTGLAGGARDRLLAAVPILLLSQMVLLPVYLGVMTGGTVAEAMDYSPFLDALIWLILVPLTAAGLTQLVTCRRWNHHVTRASDAAMVPLMMATLGIVSASQIEQVILQGARIASVIPVYVAFAIIMIGAGIMVGQQAKLDTASRRAVVFTGVTRNSLVVLPLALAMAPRFPLAPAVVVTQTLVELLIMVAMVWCVPRLLPNTVSGTQ